MNIVAFLAVGLPASWIAYPVVEETHLKRKSIMKNVTTIAVASALPLLFASVMTFASNNEQVAPDNTKMNEPSHNNTSVTADSQKNNTSDLEITRSIRRELTSKDGLSTYAQNIKIITMSGKVTLKGPVRSMNEKSKAEQIAKSVAGVTNVLNELSVVKR